jgi:hypothetical protein
MKRNNIKEATRLRQVKKHLFENRNNLTEERFAELIDTFAGEVYSFAYTSGWNARNIISRAVSTCRRIRMRSDWDEVYSKHTEAIGNVDGTKPFNTHQLELIENIIKDWL